MATKISQANTLQSETSRILLEYGNLSKTRATDAVAYTKATSFADKELAKQKLITKTREMMTLSDQTLELARKAAKLEAAGNLSQSDKNVPTTGVVKSGSGAVTTSTAVDITGTANDLVASGSGSATDVEDAGDDIVVVGRKLVDHRIRIRAKTANEDLLYGAAADTGVTAPLRATRGVIFPYTPTVTMAHTANYSQMTPIHANTDYYLYTNSPAVQIQISGQFSAQNQAEAQYMMAAMHFFRTVTKMHFGENDDDRGLPPPVLLLSGYSDFMFNDLSVIVTSFSMDLPNNVDYIEISVNGHEAFLPALTTFNISAVVQQTPKKQRDFDFGEFASGDLMKTTGWI